MRKVCILSVVLSFFVSCTHQTKEDTGLFQVEHLTEKDCKLSDLIDVVQYIPLETSDLSLLPALSKVLSVRGSIYAGTEKEILKFDDKGMFVGKLSKLGNGPQDYLSINDYDIVLREGKIEIWVAHHKGISRYDAEDFSFMGHIPLDMSVSHFKYVSDDAIVLQTSGEYSFNLCDMNGVKRNDFLPNDPANLSHSLMQFVETDDGVFNILAGTDEAVFYNKEKNALELLKYIGGIDRLLTRDDNRAYMEKFGYLEYPREVERDFVNVVTFRKKRGHDIFPTFG